MLFADSGEEGRGGVGKEVLFGLLEANAITAST